MRQPGCARGGIGSALSVINPGHTTWSRRCLRFLLALAVLVFVWRLLDIIDEALSDAVKMSFGPLMLTGTVASIVQLSVLLLIALFIRRVAGALRLAQSP